MTKRFNIIIALLLIAAGVVIKVLSDRADGSVDLDLTGFFSGILIGVGMAYLGLLIIPKRKKN